MASQWIITPSSPPLYILKCSKCSKKMSYYCSEKFRLNSQKKYIDVWLIYKCQKCNSSFNIDIMTRINPNKIDRKEFDRFINNDKQTAWKYAFSKETIIKNKVTVDYHDIEYIISGNVLTLEEIAIQQEQILEFEIKVNYALNLDITYVIRKALNVSRSQLEQMFSEEVIKVDPDEKAKNNKIKRGQKVVIDRLKVIKFLNECQNKITDKRVIKLGDTNND